MNYIFHLNLPLINLNVLTPNIIEAKIKRNNTSSPKYVIPTPFNKIALRATIKYFAGTIYEITCKKVGIFFIGKIKPDKIKVGRREAKREILNATWEESEIVEINNPIPKAPIIKRMIIKYNNIMLPFICISNTITPKNKTNVEAINPSNKYGIALPIIISKAEIGET